MNWRNISFILAGVILLLLFTRNCGGDTVVYTPEIKGTLHDKKPIEHKPLEEVYSVGQNKAKNTPRTASKSGKSPEKTIGHDIANIDSLISENKSLKERFAKASDSMKIAMFNQSAQLNTFDKTLENDTIRIRMYGIVTGKINDIGADYTIKPIKVKVSKPSRFGIGISAGVDIYGKPNINAGLTYNIIRL